jgi:hypothetical protein
VNAIQNFFSRVFNDLRARRLLPVAALLVAGLIAAPIVLSKSGDETPAPAPAPSADQDQAGPKGPEALAQVTLEDALSEGNGSSLSAFDSNDPFAPPEKVLKAARDEATGDTGQLTAPEGGATAPGTDTGTGVPGETGGGGGGGGGGGTGEGEGEGGGTKTSEFTYVLDVTFWSNGHKRRIKNLEKLDMLPNQINPLLIYMGVTENAGNAVFMVDATLSAAGEGKCKPSRDDCAFLYLGAGSEEEFTNDEGDSYRLIVNEIKRVKIGDESGTAASAGDDAGAAASKAGKTAHAAIEGSSKARRFDFPDLADVVVETSESIDDSTDGDNRR